MGKYEKLGFITAQEIAEEAEKLNPDALEGIVNALNNGQAVVSFPYNEQSTEQPEGSFTPEFTFEQKRKTYTHVDGDIYTDSTVFFHIMQAHTRQLTIKGYLENLLSQVQEAERVAKKQQEKLGGIEEGRVEAEMKGQK